MLVSFRAHSRGGYAHDGQERHRHRGRRPGRLCGRHPGRPAQEIGPPFRRGPRRRHVHELRLHSDQAPASPDQGFSRNDPQQSSRWSPGPDRLQLVACSRREKEGRRPPRPRGRASSAKGRRRAGQGDGPAPRGPHSGRPRPGRGERVPGRRRHPGQRQPARPTCPF